MPDLVYFIAPAIVFFSQAAFVAALIFFDQ